MSSYHKKQSDKNISWIIKALKSRNKLTVVSSKLSVTNPVVIEEMALISILPEYFASEAGKICKTSF